METEDAMPATSFGQQPALPDPIGRQSVTPAAAGHDVADAEEGVVIAEREQAIGRHQVEQALAPSPSRRLTPGIVRLPAGVMRPGNAGTSRILQSITLPCGQVSSKITKG
jgi:hypothetical protein